MASAPPEFFARIYARHGHRCPMSTLGGRLGLAAVQMLGEVSGDIRAIYSNRTCALDGIAEATGCSEEGGSLVVAVDGSHTLTLESAGSSVQVAVTAHALSMAGRYRSLCNRLESGWEELAADEQARRKGEMDALLDDLLVDFWQAEDALLVQKISG